jgi:predicted SAM-dependent methyltransferase
MMSLPYINLGCGAHFDPRWVNVDFTKTGDGVIAHNLTKGIPFADETFEVVYHSHVLEHFSKNGAEQFIMECFRTLKKNGVIRIAIPNLESIISCYTQLIAQLKINPEDKYLQSCYDWIMLELYDQTVRNYSGGDMVQFLSRRELINEEFIIERCGYEVKDIIDYFKKVANQPQAVVEYRPTILQRIKNLPSTVRRKLITILLGPELSAFKIGQFRLSGEIHSWMYDSVSLSRLLKSVGFSEIREVNANESRIPNWASFGLELVGSEIRKPDSLFMEAVKI